MDNKEIVIRFFEEGYTHKQYDFIMECVSEDYVDHSPAGARSNADAVNILKIVAGQFSDLTVTMLDVFAEGNMVATRVLYEGTHTGTLFSHILSLRCVISKKFPTLLAEREIIANAFLFSTM